MASKNVTEVEETNQKLIENIQSLIAQRKIIFPFAAGYFSCQALSSAKNVEYIDLAQYDGIESYSAQDQVITVQAGIKIKNLRNFLLQQERWIPIAYYDDDTSLLDVLLSAETGPFESISGGLRRHVLGLESITGTGDLVKSGGRVVKNVAGYDLTRFFIGSYGYLALPIKAHLRLYAAPKKSLTLLFQADQWHKLMGLATDFTNSGIEFAYMQLLNQQAVQRCSLNSKYQTDEGFILATSIYGDQEIVADAQRFMNTSADKLNIKHISISDIYEQENFLQQLSQLSWFSNKIPFPKSEKSCILDLAVINRSKLTLLLNNTRLSSSPFVYSITSKRLRVLSQIVEDQDSLTDHLTTFAKNNRLELPAAYGNDKYVRNVTQLGYDTKSGGQLEDITRLIKEQLDPHALFNPYVNFSL